MRQTQTKTKAYVLRNKGIRTDRQNTRRMAEFPPDKEMTEKITFI